MTAVMRCAYCELGRPGCTGFVGVPIPGPKGQRVYECAGPSPDPVAGREPAGSAPHEKEGCAVPGIQGPAPISGQLAPTSGYQLCAWCGGGINNGVLARVLVGEYGVHLYFHDPGLGSAVAVASVSSCWDRYLLAIRSADQ